MSIKPDFTLIGQGARQKPVEIKSGATVARNFFSGPGKWMALAGDMGCDPPLIHGGDTDYFHKGIRVVVWRGIALAASAE